MKKSKRIFVLLFTLVFAASLFVAPTKPAKAESTDTKSISFDKDDSAPERLKRLTKSRRTDDQHVSGVHSDPSTFEKNFVLTVDQKEYTITEIDKVVNEILNDNMSDLEKYYTLAIWEISELNTTVIFGQAVMILIIIAISGIHTVV